MREKTFYKAIILFIFLSIILPFSSGLSEEAIPGDLADNVEKTRDIIESTQDQKETYLTSEWTNTLKNNEKTKWIYGLDPLFKFLMGVNFSISWAFVTAILIWTIVFSFMYPFLRTAFENKWFSIGLTLIITAIFAQVAMQQIIEKMSIVTKTIWSQAINIIALIILALLLNRFGKIIRKYFKERGEQNRIDHLEEENKKNTTVRKEYENIKKGAEDMRRGADGAD